MLFDIDNTHKSMEHLLLPSDHQQHHACLPPGSILILEDDTESCKSLNFLKADLCQRIYYIT